MLPNAWKHVEDLISEMSGGSTLRMASKKAGPVVTDQGNLILDVLLKMALSFPKNRNEN